MIRERYSASVALRWSRSPCSLFCRRHGDLPFLQSPSLLFSEEIPRERGRGKGRFRQSHWGSSSGPFVDQLPWAARISFRHGFSSVSFAPILRRLWESGVGFMGIDPCIMTSRNEIASTLKATRCKHIELDVSIAEYIWIWSFTLPMTISSNWNTLSYAWRHTSNTSFQYSFSKSNYVWSM